MLYWYEAILIYFFSSILLISDVLYLKGATTKQTLTLALGDSAISVYVHDEDGISLTETVHYKVCKYHVTKL